MGSAAPWLTRAVGRTGADGHRRVLPRRRDAYHAPNGGHLVRIVGPGFELVRTWASTGVPLSVVFRAIDLKAARHQAGTSRRPLRIEFCDDDVRELFAGWRRAVGIPASSEPDPAEPVAEPDEPAGAARRTATKELDRAIDRLSRADRPARLARRPA